MKLCVVSSGIEEARLPLQPVRYIHEFCKNAQRLGVEIKVLSDGFPRLPQRDLVETVSVLRLNGVRCPPFFGNRGLQAAIEKESPDALVWHMGASSMWHLDVRRITDRPIIGLFTSPIYRVKDMLPLGISGIIFELAGLYAVGLGALVPAFLTRRLLQDGGISAVVVLSNAVKEALAGKGVSLDRTFLVRPGVDDKWLNSDLDDDERNAIREGLGWDGEHFVVAFFGPPASYRGSGILLHAVAKAAASLGNLRLLLLSRRREGEFDRAQEKLEGLIQRLGLQGHTKLVSRSLHQEDLIRFVASADVVALPFKLVPSEAPLSVLEAMALGKPVISTLVDGLPELLADGRGIAVRPSAPAELAEALMYLACTPNVVPSMGRRSREFVRTRGGWKEATQEILQVIEEQLQ